MSNTIFTTDGNYLKLAYTHEADYVRPANTEYTEYNYTIEYTSSGYTPTITGEYTDENDLTFPCKSIVYPVAFSTSLSPVAVELYSTNNQVVVGVTGDSADATPHSVRVKIFIFMQSNSEVTND